MVGTAVNPAASSSDDRRVAALQASDGRILRYRDDDSVEPWCIMGRELVFPQMCTQMALCRMDNQVSVDCSIYLSVYLSVCLSVCLYLSICRFIYSFICYFLVSFT